MKEYGKAIKGEEGRGNIETLPARQCPHKIIDPQRHKLAKEGFGG